MTKTIDYEGVPMEVSDEEYDKWEARMKVQTSTKPILCLDFDGVLHSYTSGWKGIDVIPDPPVPGATAFLRDASAHFDIHIFSSRSRYPHGAVAMFYWLRHWVLQEEGGREPNWLSQIKWPDYKPSAHVTLDDRAVTFRGVFPDPKQLLDFKTWQKEKEE